MDLFGAFQICAIGVLAAPATVRISSTYFSDPGRNIIFVWSMIVLAGLLSLAVEFYRSGTSTCVPNAAGMPLYSPDNFPYGKENCSLVCDPINGPFSPLRGGSANNNYVIPAPTFLTFNAATLIAAACCIPGILLQVVMAIKILELSLKKRLGDRASLGKMKNQKRIEVFRNMAEFLVFGGGVLAILVVGERNLYSREVVYETEPMASIGQWSPIVVTAFALLGSLYVLIIQAMRDEEEDEIRKKYPAVIRWLARFFSKMGRLISNPAPASFDISEFRRGSATVFPSIPAEEFRNSDLTRIQTNYNSSRRGSNESILSRLSRERSGTVGTIASAGGIFAEPDTEASSNKEEQQNRPKKRRDTLEVPMPSPPPLVHRVSTQSSQAEVDSILASPISPHAPTIVLSPNDDT